MRIFNSDDKFTGHINRANFERVEEAVYTSSSGGAAAKEENLKRIFEQIGLDYSRDAVKDILYSEYKSKGGYKSRAALTDWIFEAATATATAD